MTPFREILLKTRKVTDFKSLPVDCWKNNQVTSKCQIDFLDETCKKRSKTEKVSITIKFQNSLGTRFSTDNFEFWTKLTLKGHFQSIKEKMKITIHILHIRINLCSKF